jgi:gas vesicle protein
MSNKSSVVTALLAFASGVALGVLMAPASGKETRKKIRKNAVGVKDTLGYGVLRAGDFLSKAKGKKESTPSDTKA